MNVTRRALRPPVTIGSPASKVPPQGLPADEITYKGYRIEAASYYINSTTWSPRAVVSVRSDAGWSRPTPLYSTSTARFPSRDEANRCALGVAKAWIDTATERQRD